MTSSSQHLTEDSGSRRCFCRLSRRETSTQQPTTFYRIFYRIVRHRAFRGGRAQHGTVAKAQVSAPTRPEAVSAVTPTKQLITRRSRVQIPPPPPSTGVKAQVSDLGLRLRGGVPPDHAVFLRPFLRRSTCSDPVHAGHRGSGSWLTLSGRGSGSWATVVPVPQRLRRWRSRRSRGTCSLPPPHRNRMTSDDRVRDARTDVASWLKADDRCRVSGDGVRGPCAERCPPRSSFGADRGE
jgi:hypothetical protein